jgi:hypothetical protein
MERRSFSTYDDWRYCITVEEWEKQALPDLMRSKGIHWASVIGPMVFFVGSWVEGDWRRWVSVSLLGFVMWRALILLEELTENVRYVRRQLRALRDAVKESQIDVSGHPQRSELAASDILQVLDRHWDQP